MRIPLALGKQTAAGRVAAESDERLLNAFVESVPQGKEPTPVYGTPGLKPWASGLLGGCRGWVAANDVLYAVCGGQLYSFDAAGAATALGAVPNADQVSIDADETHVVLVTSGKIYVYPIGAGPLTLVTDPDAPNASFVAAIDGFFLFGELDTEQYFICALGDPLNYDALDFASAEWKPDRLRAGAVVRKTVMLLGATTTEAITNTGAAAFPFQAYQDLKIGAGIAGRDAWTVSNEALYWAAHDYTARRLDGATAAPISTGRVSRIFKSWSDFSATIVSDHVFDDHLFIVFWNPDGCVAYDQSTQLWHERASYASKTWRPCRLISCFGKTLAASYAEGKIYELDPDTFDEDGAVLEFEMVTPYAYQGNKRLAVGELEVVTQTGEAAAGTDPKITCEKTRDGKTWGIRKQRSLGRSGEYEKQVRFGPQGQARQMAWRVRITDPVRRAVLGIYAEVDVEA